LRFEHVDILVALERILLTRLFFGLHRRCLLLPRSRTRAPKLATRTALHPRRRPHPATAPPPAHPASQASSPEEALVAPASEASAEVAAATAAPAAAHMLAALTLEAATTR